MKTTIYTTLALLFIATSQTKATVTESDNFNDNARDASLWSVYRVSAEREWVEQNGRLEAISTAGVYTNDTGVWEWTGPKPAFDENWTVTFDATINLTGTTPGSSTWIGFLAADSILSNTATVEQWVQHGIRGVDTGAKVNGDDLWEVNELISSNTVTLRMNYDSGKQELHASYDDGSGYWSFLASLSVTNWGMTDADDFRILIFGGSEEDGLASGQAYGDNFSFEINNIESDPEAIIPCQSIVGSWYMKNKEVPSHDNVVLTFLANGIYFMCQDGDSVFDDHGVDGMEKGNYTWDSITGDFSITNVQEDTNNEWGLSGWQDNVFNLMLVTNNTLYMRPEGEGPYLLHRVVAQTSPASIVGAWLIDGVAAVTFLDNGIYYLAHAHIPGGGGQAGMERGIYDWDPITGEFNPMPIVDTNGEWGLSHGHDNDTITIAGNTLYLTVEGEGTYPGYRIVDPDCSDIDADGLPDAFEIQISGNPTNAVPEGNSDSDDLTDREEFIAGTLPGDGSSVFAVSNALPSPSGFVLNWNAIEGRVYTVQWTDHLTNAFQNLEANITYPQNSYTDTVHNTDDGGFYNLKVELGK
jgi:hypothetical protein